MIGLYASITQNGNIKRHLSTDHGEVPLKDTTVSSELISLAEKTFLDICVFIKEVLIPTFDSDSYEAGARYLRQETEDFLSEQEAIDPMYAVLTRTLIADSTHNRKNKRIVIDEIVRSLRNPISAQALTLGVLDLLCSDTLVNQSADYPLIRKFCTTAVFTLNNALSVSYVFRSYEQYYRFLLQHFIASKPKIAKCQYCGGYFIPKTQRKTLYCDRVIRDGKTCKQIAPYLNHKERAAADTVVSEYNRIKDMLLHRLDRVDYDKKPSPIDLTQEEYYKWLDTATNARDHYLAGGLSKDAALRVIHVPTVQEIREANLVDYTSCT